MTHPIRKRFGQHFLHDPTVIHHIIEAINLQLDDNVIEIGPGLGAMTLPLLQKCSPKNYIALEIDRDAIASIKKQTSEFSNFNIIEADALRTDINELLPNEDSLRVIGNLPYNISTPLIFHLLEYKARISNMVFMLQKEVVDRMVAGPDNKIYGRLSVMVQAHCSAEKLFNVPPGAFNPPPKVDSAIVRLIPHSKELSISDAKVFADLVRDAFNQRRKTIRNSMRNYLSADDFQNLELDSKLRAENLRVSEFVRIANYIAKNAPADLTPPQATS